MTESIHPTLLGRLVDSLYVEAMVMADEARSCFDRQCNDAQRGLDPITRLGFTCESLKVTTRLMHVIAWLLVHRGWRKGEVAWAELADPKYLLGDAEPADRKLVVAMSDEARALVSASEELYARVRRLQDRLQGVRPDNDRGEAVTARALQHRLEALI